MSNRPQAGLIEVWRLHNASTVCHTFTATNIDASTWLTPGREAVGVKLDLVDGMDAQGQPVLQALFATYEYVIIRPPGVEGGS